MIIVVDVGNSRLKWCTCSEGYLGGIRSQSHAEDWIPSLRKQWSSLNPERVVVASVATPAIDNSLAYLVRELWQLKIEFVQATAEAFGVSNGYQSPERLGVDRWAAMVAAWNNVRRPCVVVDAGSAITVDLIDQHGQHLGGMIAPGVGMMVRGLTHETAGLSYQPSVKLSAEPGQDSQSCMNAGITAMLSGFVQKLRTVASERLDNNAAWLLTGGDAHWLLAYVKDAIMDEKLVCKGIVLLGGGMYSDDRGNQER